MSAPSGYAAVLRLPGALRVFVPALLGRLSFGMVTLALLFAVQGSTGSYAVAGAATGLFGLANVLASPYRARLVDRWGQRATLSTLAVAYALGLSGLAALTAEAGPAVWAVLVLAAAAGFFPPPLGAAMRVLWGTIAPTPAMRTRAYSVDAVAEEVLFTTGPLIVVAIITVTSPPAGLLATAGAAFVGTLLMTSGAASRTQRAGREPAARHARPLRQAGFRSVLLALLGIGCVLGTVEVAAPAFATNAGSPVVAGVLLASFSAGSMIGGLIYGHWEWKSALAARLLVLGVLLALFSGLLVLAFNVVVLGIGLALVGFFLAPSLVTGYLLADELTAPQVRTEASSWINTAVNTGAAIAAAGGGLVVDYLSTPAAFAFGTVAALVCLAIAVPLLTRSLTSRPARAGV